MQPGNPIVGGTTLRIPAIQSPDYVTGVSGWTINIDGTVEFNSGTFRGTVTAGTFAGTNFVINSAGAFFYSGTPALGNMVLSIASSAGIDSFGNAYVRGQGTYSAGVSTYQLDSSTGTLRAGTSGAAHWTFDVAASQFSMFDLNAALTGRMSAAAGNSNFLWLYNTALRYFALNGGAFQLGGLSVAGAIPTASDQANAAGFGLTLGSAPSLDVNGPKNTSGAGAVAYFMQMVAGSAGGTVPGSLNNPKLSIGISGATDIALFGGALYRSDLSGWQAPAYKTNWGTNTAFNGSSNNQGLRYTIDNFDSIFFEGGFKAGAVAPAATVLTNVAPYLPNATTGTNGWLFGWRNRAATVIPMGFQYTLTGNLNVVSTVGGGAPAANDEYYIPRQQMSLGNLP